MYVILCDISGADPGYECTLPEVGVNSTTKYENNGNCEITILTNGSNMTESCKYGYSYGDEYKSTILTEVGTEMICDALYL